jgi:hypothetical protein
VAVAGIALAWLTYQRRTIDAARLAGLFGPIRRAALARFWIDDAFEAGFTATVMPRSAPAPRESVNAIPAFEIDNPPGAGGS